MKRLIPLLCLVFLCTAISAARAEYGEWTELYSLGGPPGLSNAAFMALGIGDADHFYTSGMQQTGALDITSAWRSNTGGTSWTPVITASMTGSDCGILDMFTIMLTAEAASAETAIFAGVRVSPDCAEQYEFPACLFMCIFQIESVLFITHDGGDTYEAATVNGNSLYSMVMAIDFLDENIGYAAGGPQFLLRTQDGGDTWNRMNAPGNLITVFNDVQFLDENTGYIANGIPEEEKGAAANQPGAERARLLHQVRYLKDPVYRLQWQADHPGAEAPKATDGVLYRTTNGGQSWETLLEDPNAGFLNVEMLDEERGFVLGEPHTGKYPVVLYYTEDSGETWQDITDRLPQDLGSVLKWAVASLSFQPVSQSIGFIGGAGQSLLSYTPVLFYTEDQGQTWAYDEAMEELGNPILQIKWLDPKTAYSAGFDLSFFRYDHGNVRPVADAGEDGEGKPETAITLDGSGSFDYENDPLTYQWTQLSGATATIADAAAETTTFTAAAEGEVVFELTVNDGTQADTDTVIFTISEDAPTDDDDDDTADDDDTTDDDDTADDDDATDDDAGPAADDDDDDEGGCGC